MTHPVTLLPRLSVACSVLTSHFQLNLACLETRPSRHYHQTESPKSQLERLLVEKGHK